MIQAPPTSTAETPAPDEPEIVDDPDVPIGPVGSDDQIARIDGGGRGRVWRWVDVTGRTLVGVGALVLVFLAYQLWGTAVLEDRAQQGLADELQETIEQHRASAVAPTRSQSGPRPTPELARQAGPTEPDVIVVPSRPAPESGSAVARIQAPTIGLDKTVVEGVGRVQLREGPGRYPVSALPGHVGNVAIAGHRTTHGSPFAHLDQLQPGDPITPETVDGVFTYRVEAQVGDDGATSGHRIVTPDDTGVINSRGDNRLTLTSCHPRYSDRQRLVVSAVLEGTPLVFEQPPPVAMAPTVVADRLDPADAADRTAPPVVADAPAVGSAEQGLDEALGWRWGRVGVAALWFALVLAALVPSALLRRRSRTMGAIAVGLMLGIYPFVHLLMTIDRLAPAF